ncbi:MAG: hypothetical protein F6K19_16815 [Cyanothece sp. SIO1E1]|nr:hypothetical protein [Cyanothece sp. SIO1E1]
MSTTKKLTKKQQQLVGLIFGIAGVCIFLIGIGLFPVELQPGDAPGWVVAICGAIFALAGVMIFIGDKSNNFLAGVLIAMMGSVGGWVALFGDATNVSGGFSFVSEEMNFTLARIFFGIGALVCFAISVHAFRLHFRKRKSS